MKYNLIGLMLICAFSVNGQSFNFQKQSIDANKITNSNFTFKVTNINTLKYQVFISNVLVNNNIAVPDLLKLYLFKSDSAKTQGSTEDESSKIVGGSIDELISLYYELKTCEQFYSGLNELVNSDLPTDDMIRYKKGYFSFFIKKSPEADSISAARILSKYSGLIDKTLMKLTAIDISGLSHKIVQQIDSIKIQSFQIKSSKIP